LTFLGIDLGWINQPTGLARLDHSPAGRPAVSALLRHPTHADVLAWIDEQAGSQAAMLAIDAPLVIPNAGGIRECERAVNADFRRHHAGCHAANRGRPFYASLAAFVAGLEERGFQHAADITPGAPGRYMIEVHPHAAAVSVFNLEKIIKYKKGRVADRARELARFRDLLGGLVAGQLPVVPTEGRALKAVEDQLDAVFAAWIGLRWWQRGSSGGRCYGSVETGYIVVPAQE
jgi:predicted RNase H-like nuclease